MVGLGLLGLGLLGWLLFAYALLDLAAMRSLRAVKSADDLEEDLRGPRVLEGKLRVRDGRLKIRGGKAIAEGSVVVESADLRLRWPSDEWVPISLWGKEPVRDGSVIAVMGTFETLARAGHREMFARWPKDSRALSCGRDQAARWLSSRAARRASLAITPAVIGLLACGLLFVSYLL